jgi:hypothetical protein
MGANTARQVQTKALDVWLREQELELSVCVAPHVSMALK